MKFIAHERGYCVNCGKDRGPTLICQSCGWADPQTTKTPITPPTADVHTPCSSFEVCRNDRKGDKCFDGHPLQCFV